MIHFQENEKVLRICRRHWLNFAANLLPVALALALAIAAPFLVREYLPDIFRDYVHLVFFSAALMLEIFWMILFLVIIDFYLDAWVVTDERLILIELHGVFSRTVSSVSLRNIQDVGTFIHGFFQTVLKYGDVRIQSAGTHGEFIFKQVPNPEEVKDLILRAKEDFLKPRNDVSNNTDYSRSTAF
jgi:uncharacterized membrane protein YdbT with pleckstrin-like domain